MADTFEYKCSQCGDSLTLPVSLLGQQGECPSCHHVELLSDASKSASENTPPLAAYPVSPHLDGTSVTSEKQKTSSNPFSSPKQQAFEFASVNPNHRGRLGTTLWGLMIASCLTFIWTIYIIVAPFIGIARVNPKLFEEPQVEQSDDWDEIQRSKNDDNGIEILYALAEYTSDFQQKDVANLSPKKAAETAFSAFLGGYLLEIAVWLILAGTGYVCYLTFFHTLWTQIQDDPAVKFSPAKIVSIQFIPFGLLLIVPIYIFLQGGRTFIDFFSAFDRQPALVLALLILAVIASIASWVIMFITYWKLADYMEKYFQLQGIVGRRASPSLALAFCIMQVGQAAPFVGGLIQLASFILWFIVVFQLKNSAIDIINHKIQTEQAARI